MILSSLLGTFGGLSGMGCGILDDAQDMRIMAMVINGDIALLVSLSLVNFGPFVWLEK